MAIGAGYVLKRTVFKTDSITPFVMELPSYRRPSLRGIWAYISTKISSFVRKAWGLIMVTSVILWVLMAIPVQGNGSFANVSIEDSAFGKTAMTIAPVFSPAGFGSWEASSSLITGFVAKEVVVSTLSQVYGLEESDAVEMGQPTTFFEDLKDIVTSFGVALWDTVKAIPLVVGIDVTGQAPDEDAVDIAFYDAIRNGFNQSSGGHGSLASYAFMVFVLLYTPCMVAVAAMRQELGKKWMWVSIIGQFTLAWVVSVIVFQVGLLFA
jgi:ferrous iron transport protein B